MATDKRVTSTDQMRSGSLERKMRQTNSLAEWSGFSRIGLWVQLVGLVLAVRHMDRDVLVSVDQLPRRCPDFPHLLSLPQTQNYTEFSQETPADKGTCKQ